MADIPPGILPNFVTISPLQSLSPSNLTQFKKCPLRGVWATSRTPELLPPFPAARLGSAIHQLLEEAGGGQFAGDRSHIEQRWQDIVSGIESEMTSSWLERHLAPLRDSVPDFEVRRIQAIERARELSHASTQPASTAKQPGDTNIPGAQFELFVEATNGTIRGYIDAVFPTEDGPVLRDYKSGDIFEDGLGETRTVKEAYVEQLQLYAALYAENFNQWPSRAEIVPLAGPAEAIPLDRTTCSDLVAKATQTLHETNAAIKAESDDFRLQEKLAVPSPENCAFCPFRPACAPYQREALSDQPGQDWPRDAAGRVERIERLGNSKLFVQLRTPGDQVIRIRKLEPSAERHPALDSIQEGDQLAAFNLAGDRESGSFAESRFTVLYNLVNSGDAA